MCRVYHVSYCICVFCVVVSIILHIISVFIQDRFTALILAAMYNKTEVAALLIESGANIDLQDKVLYMYSFMLMNICSSRCYGQLPVLHIYCPIIEVSLSMKVYYTTICSV